MSLGSTVTTLPAFIYLNAYLGAADASSQNIIQYQSASSLTAGVTTVSTQQIAASATNSSFNLATIFSTAAVGPLFVCVSDITNPGIGFYITTVSGSGKISIGVNGFFAWIASSALALPTVYIDNPSSTSVLNLSFGLLGN